MPDRDAGHAGDVAGGALHDVDLLIPDTLRLGGPATTAWCLLQVGGLPVARSVLPVDASGAVEQAALVRQMTTAATSSLIADALARFVVGNLSRGGGTGLGAAMEGISGDGTATDLPTLTIAICTRERPEPLTRALAALRPLSGDGVEVLVVENAPTQQGALVDLRASHPWVRFVVEPQVGLDAARNRALTESRTPLVALTDDDTVVSPSFARRVREAFAAAPEVAVVCGLVEPLHPGTEGAQAVESYGGLGRGYRRAWGLPPEPAPRWLVPSLGITTRFGSGASFAMRRDAAIALGGFDTALDAGTPTGAGGDLEFLFRALKAGHAVCYEPAAVLRHEHRSTGDAALEQVEQWGAGMGAYLARTAAAYPEERMAVRLLLAWLLATHYGRRLAVSLVGRSIPGAMLRRDVRGLFRGAQRYREAAPQVPPPAAPRAPAGPTTPSRSDVEIDLRQPLPNLTVPAASRVYVSARLDGAALGTVPVRSVRGLVGAARIADAVSRAFVEPLIGVRAERAGQALLDALRTRA